MDEYLLDIAHYLYHFFVQQSHSRAGGNPENSASLPGFPFSRE
jgi:hypothetical protein